MLGSTTSLKGWSGTGMGCPERWWSHRAWRCSRNFWTWCWGTWFSENHWWWVNGFTVWSCGSFPTLVILWFYDSKLGSKVAEQIIVKKSLTKFWMVWNHLWVEWSLSNWFRANVKLQKDSVYYCVLFLSLQSCRNPSTSHKQLLAWGELSSGGVQPHMPNYFSERVDCMSAAMAFSSIFFYYKLWDISCNTNNILFLKYQ